VRADQQRRSATMNDIVYHQVFAAWPQEIYLVQACPGLANTCISKKFHHRHTKRRTRLCGKILKYWGIICVI
jgi:hypothetical protein